MNVAVLVGTPDEKKTDDDELTRGWSTNDKCCFRSLYCPTIAQADMPCPGVDNEIVDGFEALGWEERRDASDDDGLTGAPTTL